MTESTQHAPRRDVWISLGMAVSALSAAVSSFAGLRELAVAAGWPELLSPLFPLTVDAYAMTATRVWLMKSAGSPRARRFARTNAILAILMSLAGNATWHLMAVGLVAANWMVVVAVGAVPALVLGLVSHLAVLRSQVDRDVPPAARGRPEAVPEGRPGVPGPAARTGDGPRYRSEDELLEAARAADEAHRTHYGRTITRDGLRQALRIGGTRATELLRRLKDEAVAAPVGLEDLPTNRGQ